MKNSDQTLHSSQSTHRTEWKEYSIFNKNITAGSLQYLWKTNMHYFVWHPFVAWCKWDQNVTNPIKRPRTKLNWFLNINYIPRSQFWMDLFGDLRDSGNLMEATNTNACWDSASEGFYRKTWMNAKTSGTNTGSGQADLHRVQGGFQTNSLLPHRYLSS